MRMAFDDRPIHARGQTKVIRINESEAGFDPRFPPTLYCNQALLRVGSAIGRPELMEILLRADG